MESKTSIAKTLSGVIPVALILVVWELLSMQPSFQFTVPPVLTVLGALYSSRVTLLIGAADTLLRTAESFVIGIITGIAVGWLIPTRRVFNKLAGPPVYVLSAAPRIALISIILVWFGVGANLYIVMGVLGAFFPACFAAISGARSVNEFYVRIAKDNEASNWQIFRFVHLPSVLPTLAAGIRLAFISAFILEVDAELIVASPLENGIGIYLAFANSILAYDQVYAGVIALAVMGSIMLLVADQLEKRMVPWRSAY